MDEFISFGRWLQQQRRTLDLTQADLGQRVGVAADTIRKIEADERRPSKGVAVGLAECLAIPLEDRPAFLRFARGESSATPPVLPSRTPDNVPWRRSHGPSHLPLQLTPLVGREREVADVCALMGRADVRLLTLVGPGGAGKTRLALQVASELLDGFADGLYFVALGTITDPALVAPVIAQTLGIAETSGRTLLESLQGNLRDKQLLLLLDNFEQVLEAAPLIADLLTTCPELKILVTSRVALHLYGEHDYPVPPLALPDPKHLPELGTLSQYEAVALFIQSAQAVKPDFQITNANAPAVAEICRRIDGLPLAIELAAAQVRFLPPQALLSRLSNRLRLLKGGARNLPPRQQTLRGTIDWSYGLLPAAEQALFARLAVFAGGSTLDATESVCSVEGGLTLDVLDGLQSLVDKSLVRQNERADGEAHFVMLETIREYALERLVANGEAASIQHMHAAYYLALAEAAKPALTGPQQGLWMNRLESDHDNLRAALQWTLERGEAEMAARLSDALSRFWMRRGYLSEGRHWLEAALAVSGSLPPDLRARASCRTGVLTRLQGDYVRAVDLYEAGLSLYRELQDEWGIAWAVNDLGLIAANQGKYDQAQALLEESLVLRRRLGDKRLIAFALDGLGGLAVEQGKYARAEALHAESLALRRQLGDKRDIGESLRRLGQAAFLLGEPRAAALLEESVALLRELGTQADIAAALRLQGVAAGAQGDYTRAEALLEESVALLRELGTKSGLATSLGHLGLVARTQRDYTRAEALLAESVVLLRELGAKSGLAWCLEGLAGVAAAQGQLARAARLWGRAEALRETIGAPMSPTDRAEYEREVTTARSHLGTVAFAAAWREGRAMSLEQAVSYALAIDEQETHG